jgi:serine/threonine-protein kinase
MGLWKASRVPGSAVPAGRSRRIAGVGAGWLAAAGLATVIGLGGIRLVGDSLTSTPGGVLSQDQVERALAGASTEPVAGPPMPEPSQDYREPAVDPSATRTPAGPAPVERSFSVRGGTAVAACRGATAYQVSWSPTRGNRVDRARRGPDREVEVRFRGDDDDSELKITCVEGAPVAERKDEDGD